MTTAAAAIVQRSPMHGSASAPWHAAWQHRALRQLSHKLCTSYRDGTATVTVTVTVLQGAQGCVCRYPITAAVHKRWAGTASAVLT